MKRESDEVLKEATLLCQDERELEAEVLVKEQLKADPDNLDLMTRLGVIQARLCNDHEAESTFRSVLIRDANHEDAMCGLGRLLDQALRTEEAEQIYRDFLKNNPKSHCAVEDLCRLLMSESRTAEALTLARNHVEKYRAHPSAYDALRYLLEILEDELAAQLNDDRKNETLFNNLMNNLLEQIEYVIEIEKIDSLPESTKSELEDDKTRLICEIKDLAESASNRDISIPNALHKRISEFV